MENLAFPLVLAVVLGFVAFRQWMRHQRQMAIHKERLVAIEKGVEPPPVPNEPPNENLGALLAVSGRPWPRGSVVLLSGLIWLAVGIGGLIAGYIALAGPAVQAASTDAPPPSAALIALVPILVGLAHLVVWRILRKDDAQQ